jgi:adenylyl cyclase-associated protein
MLDPPQRFDQFAEHLDYVPSAATARLEDVAHHSSTSQTPSHNTASSASTGVAAMPSQSSSNTASAPAELAESPAQKAYQSDVIDGALQDYVTKSKEIGGPVSEHVSHDQF